MSASQARMLSLTSRMSDLEFQAQSISNSKIRLADQSEEASRAYSNALDKQKMTVYSGLSGGTASYIDANAYNLTTYGKVSNTDKQRFIEDAAGKVLVLPAVVTAYDTSIDTHSLSYALKNLVDSSSYYGHPNGTDTGFSSVTDYLNAKLGYSTIDEFEAIYPDATDAQKTFAKNEITYNTNAYTGKEQFLNSQGYTSATADVQQNDPDYATNSGGHVYTNDLGATDYYNNLFDQIESKGYSPISEDNMKSSEWLQDQITMGNVFLYEYNKTGGADGLGAFENVSWTSGDASLQEKTDTTLTAKAEAEYETTMASIQAKDKRFDLQLKQIDTEHTAIQTELDSVKKVIDKNIERGFKTFNG